VLTISTRAEIKVALELRLIAERAGSRRDFRGRSGPYTVELNNVQLGALMVSGGTASVTITEPFMEIVKI
jgi:hypothetical protein